MSLREDRIKKLEKALTNPDNWKPRYCKIVKETGIYYDMVWELFQYISNRMSFKVVFKKEE